MSTQRRFSGCGIFLVCVGACLAVALILSALVGTSYETLATSRLGGAYTVQPGDTLSSIATRHRTTVEALVAANGIADADQIEVGQRLRVVGEGVVRTKPQTPPARVREPAPLTPVQEPHREEPAARAEAVQSEIRRSEKDPCRYYFVSLSRLDDDRLSVLTRQECPTYGTYYERIELNCRSAEFRYIGGAAKPDDIVSRPSDWFDFSARSAKEDTARFACARAERELGDKRSPEPEPLDVPNDAELHTLFMDCSAYVSALMRPVAQKRCFDIGAYLHARYIQQERWGDATTISDRMKAVGWWGWISPKYRPVR